MKKPHPIDELFKQQLANSSAEVPTDMWDRIQEQRQGRNKKPPFIWMWASLAVVALSAASLLYFNAPLSNIDVGTFPISPTQKTETNTPQVIAAATAAPTAILQQTTKNKDKQAPLNQVTKDEVTSLSSAISTKKKEATFTAITKNNNKVSSNEHTILNTKEKQVVKTTANTSTHNSKETTHNSPEAETSRITGPHIRRNQAVDLIEQRSYTAQKADESIRLFTKSSTPCSRFNNPFFHLDLEILAGPAYAHQTLSALSSQSNDYLKRRQDSEYAMLSYGASARLSASSKAGIGFKAGLSYTQINDRFEHQIGSRTSIIITEGPNGETIRDTTFIEARMVSYKNELKFVELPILLSYEKRVGKFRLGLNAGAQLQLLFDAKGQIHAPDGEADQPVAFGQIGDNDRLEVFNKRASAAWFASANIVYNLHSRYSIMAEPYFKTYPRALSNRDYELKQNYWMVGMQLGLRMRL